MKADELWGNITGLPRGLSQSYRAISKKPWSRKWRKGQGQFHRKKQSLNDIWKWMKL